jgi:hypothetical protein
MTAAWIGDPENNQCFGLHSILHGAGALILSCMQAIILHAKIYGKMWIIFDHYPSSEQDSGAQWTNPTDQAVI